MSRHAPLLPEKFEGGVTPALRRFLAEARERFGCVTVFGRANLRKTVRVLSDGVNLGYVNPSVLSRGAVFGVHFPENNGDHFFDTQQASIERELRGLMTSSARANDLYELHLADGSRKVGRQYLVIKSAELALAWIAARLGSGTGPNVEPLPDWRPDEVTEDEVHVEGALRRVTVNAYQRNPDARRRCIDHHKPICQACTFDFEVTYGDIGRGFIHVHHEVELSSIGGEYVVDPIEDLVPVCPNCHAMLHTHKPALTIDELRDILHRQRMARPD